MDELQAVSKVFQHATVVLPAAVRTCLVAPIYILDFLYIYFLNNITNASVFSED
jgi:hypothetical protein